MFTLSSSVDDDDFVDIELIAESAEVFRSSFACNSSVKSTTSLEGPATSGSKSMAGSTYDRMRDNLKHTHMVTQGVGGRLVWHYMNFFFNGWKP